MPTKEEILKQLEDRYDVFVEYGEDSTINPILTAMEEYAKQEGLEFIAFIRNHEIRYGGCHYHDVWKEYQKSKLKK